METTGPGKRRAGQKSPFLILSYHHQPRVVGRPPRPRTLVPPTAHSPAPGRVCTPALRPGPPRRGARPARPPGWRCGRPALRSRLPARMPRPPRRVALPASTVRAPSDPPLAAYATRAGAPPARRHAHLRCTLRPPDAARRDGSRPYAARLCLATPRPRPALRWPATAYGRLGSLVCTYCHDEVCTYYLDEFDLSLL